VDDAKIHDRVVLITGGAGGLGRELAAQFQRAGWSVYAPGRNELDVASSSSVQSYFSQLQQLDLVICSAGLARDGLLMQMPEADWDEVLEVNLKGAMRCARAALPLMLKQGAGHLLFISSYSAVVGPVGQANYAAAKAGLLGMSQSLAREYGECGLRVNCVMPGFLETAMTETVSLARREAVLADHALRRLNTVEDAARFILQLHDFPAISGQVFQLDSRIRRC
jgi:3-oxoacyl-[acyl-carrier protein] reductase